MALLMGGSSFVRFVIHPKCPLGPTYPLLGSIGLDEHHHAADDMLLISMNTLRKHNSQSPYCSDARRAM